MPRGSGTRIRPARLQHGMTVGVVSPASAPRDERLDRGIASLESAGYHVVLGEHARDQRGYLAGSDRERAADLAGMLARSDVDAVFCSRGGYGAVRVLRHIDWAAVARHPKLFVGYSDITTLHLAFERHLGLVTVHGPMVTTLGGELSQRAADCLWRIVTTAEPFGRYDTGSAPVRSLVGGRVAGRLAGGCLELLATALGSPEAPDFAGCIVLLEDVGIPTYRVDRALMQLLRAGVLQQAAGFVIGAITDWQKQEQGPAEITPDTLWAELLAPLGVPTIVGFPFGHEPDPLTLPLGCMAELDADACALTVVEPAVE